MHFLSKLSIAFTLLFLVRSAVWAQDITVKGGFTQDSLRIGNETQFFLSARYPSNLDIVFPDTTFNFSPFEFRKKEYFPTKTTNGNSYDSVVYYLATFEVDSVQSLSLPVFKINSSDCTAYVSKPDRVFLKAMVHKLPDSLSKNLPVKATVAYQNVSYQFNYQLWIIVLAILLTIGAVVWFVFGTGIQKYFALKRMQKTHQQFQQTFERQLQTLKNTFSVETTESTLSLWKKYMEQLNAKPYTKLTTRETITTEKDETLGTHLRMVDGAIYGHNTNVVDPLENLRHYADKRFSEKLEEVKHGQ